MSTPETLNTQPTNHQIGPHTEQYGLITVDEMVDALNWAAETPETVTATATTLQDIGFSSVMPIIGGRKYAVPSASGVADICAPDVADIHDRFERYGSGITSGISVHPAEAELIVVTVDGQYGAEAWKLLTGINLNDTASIISDTPNGGKHYWFAAGDLRTVSVHTSGLGIKAHGIGGYVIIAGGRDRRHGTLQYRHNAKSDQWTQLDLPNYLRYTPDRFEGTEVSTFTATEVINTLAPKSLWTVDSHQKIVATATNIVTDHTSPTGLFQVDPPTLAARHAIRLLRACGVARSENKVHIIDALETSFNEWHKTHTTQTNESGETWTSKALQIAWNFLLALHFSDQNLVDDEPETTTPIKAWATEVDWREPWDDSGTLKKIRIADIAASKTGICSAAAEAWEISEHRVTSAMNELLSQSGHTFDNLTTDLMFKEIFDTPDDWTRGQKLDPQRSYARIKQLADFRISADKTLWRYCHSGNQRGLWIDDGEDFLGRMLTRAIGGKFSVAAHNLALQIVKIYASGLQIPYDNSTWQRDDVIFCRNGVIEWQSGGRLRQPTPADNFTVQHPWDWDPAAECPEFNKFASDTFQPDAITAVYQVCGAVLYPRSPWKRAILLHGPRNSGKTTFLKMLTNLVGRQWTSTMSLQQISENRFMPANLFGKRLNACGDIGPDAMPDSATFKQLVGGDEAIQADVKNKNAFVFTNHAKLFFSANELPNTRDRTGAYYDRWLLLPCSNTVQGDQIDYGLEERLSSPSELSGIARKAVDALALLIEQHDYTLPESSLEAAHHYRLESDTVVAWADDRLEFTGNLDDIETTSSCRADYQEWCETHGMHPLSDKKISLSMKYLENRFEPNFVWRDRRSFGNKRTYVARGVRLRPEEAKLVSGADGDTRGEDF